jgi:hypothetical protein
MSVFGYGMACVAVGVPLYLGFPQSPLGWVGELLCFGGVMYWVWELLSIPSGRAEVPGMLRLLFSLLIASTSIILVMPFLASSRTPVVVRFIPSPPPYLQPIQNTPPPTGTITSQKRCLLVGTLTSGPVARVYARGTPEPGSSVNYTPYLQELFYEWKLAVTSNMATKNISVVVNTSYPDSDRIKVFPDTAIVSSVTPHWMSGFEESRTPDSYSRTISFPSLKEKEQASIVFRKALKFPDKRGNFSSSDFDKTYSIKAFGCDLVSSKPDIAKDQSSFIATMTQLYALGTWKYSGSDGQPLKTKLNPDDPQAPLAPNEVEASWESRCQDEKCTKITIGELEVRRGGAGGPDF